MGDSGFRPHTGTKKLGGETDGRIRASALTLRGGGGAGGWCGTGDWTCSPNWRSRGRGGGRGRGRRGGW